MDERIRELEHRRRVALAMGGPERVARHHASGRLTARERLDLLIDPGTWQEIGLLALPETRVPGRGGAADAVVTGWGRVNSRKVAVIAVDATVVSGTTAPVNVRKQLRIVGAAARAGIPIVFLSDADGGRMPDLLGWRFSGLPLDLKGFLTTPEGCPVVPRLCGALGPCYGDSALQAVSAHFTVMTQASSIALSGPTVIQSAIGEDVTHTALGGPVVALGVGNASQVTASEEEAINALRRYLTYLPDHAGLPTPDAAPRPPAVAATELVQIVPLDSKQSYDMRRVIAGIVDADSECPWRAEQGPSLITLLARLEGSVVGVVANQPMVRAGTLDAAALEKYHDFAEICDTFNIPLVLLQDLPGLMIGAQEEGRGILRRLERLATRLSATGVPKVTVIVRKAYGGGFFVMGGPQVHADRVVAWPSAELGFMAPSTGVKTVYRGRLEEERRTNGSAAHDRLFTELCAEWDHESEPWEAAAHLYIDDVIHPRDTRALLQSAVEYAWGNQPRVSRTGT